MVQGIGTWGLANTPRDLTDILSTLIQEQPFFVKMFPQRTAASSVKHEWLEDVLKPHSVAYTSCSGGTFACTDTSGWSVGDVVRVKGDPALLEITAVSEGASVTVKFLAPNGSAVTRMLSS